MRSFRGQSPRLEPGAWVAPGADVIGDVILGEDVSVWYGAVLRGDVMPLRVGARTNIQDLSLLHATSGISETVIGTDVTVGHRAVLHGCQIGNFSLVGMGAIILDNAEVGDYCLIGAGALITPGKKIPAGSVVLGSPGKIVREVTEAERRQFEESAAHYIALARQHAEG